MFSKSVQPHLPRFRKCAIEDGPISWLSLTRSPALLNIPFRSRWICRYIQKLLYASFEGILFCSTLKYLTVIHICTCIWVNDKNNYIPNVQRIKSFREIRFFKILSYFHDGIFSIYSWLAGNMLFKKKTQRYSRRCSFSDCLPDLMPL